MFLLLKISNIQQIWKKSTVRPHKHYLDSTINTVYKMSTLTLYDTYFITYLVYPSLYPSINLLFLVHFKVNYRYQYTTPQILQHALLRVQIFAYGFSSFDVKLTYHEMQKCKCTLV